MVPIHHSSAVNECGEIQSGWRNNHHFNKQYRKWKRRLTIKDEGPGIKAHDLPRIFDKGFTGGTGRLHNAATGLGLYLAQTVAEKIGITLTAQSEMGQGTTMKMMFSTENDFDKTLT